MSQTIKPNKTVSPFLLWFILHSSQTGVGMLSFQQKATEGAEQDAWVSVLAVSLFVHLMIVLMFYILRYAKEGDLISLHRQLFGRAAGSVLSLAVCAYAVLAVSGQIRTYAEVIHVWVFPDSPLWQLSLLILAIAVYVVLGGFRVITGICFVSVIIPTLLTPTLYFPLKFAHWSNFLPVLNHNLADYLKTSGDMVFIYLGAEFMMFYAPYVKDFQKSQKWAHLAIIHTTVLYLVLLFVTVAYFNMDQMKNMVWPSLVLSKIIHFAYLERFDYLYTFNWLIVILSVCCVGLWVAVRILKKTLRVPPKWGVALTSAAVFASVQLQQTPVSIAQVEKVTSMIGCAILFGYIPLLFLYVGALQLFRRKDARPDPGS